MTPRAEPSSSLSCYNLKYIICGQAQNSGIRQKFRICESESAENFREATLFLQDEVYIRTCDLQDASKVFGADLYYHRTCLPSYINKYHPVKRKKKTSNIIKPTKRDTFILYTNFLQTIFDAGTAISLSEIRGMINDESNINIIKSEVKIFLTKHFAEKIQFCPFEQANESLFVFSYSICINDVVKRLRFLDTTKNIAEKLRKSLIEIDLDLHDKFCGREDLFGSWDNLPLSDEILTFLGTLFNINLAKLLAK